MPKAKSDAAEEAAEKPFERNLSLLGKATLATMKRRFGEEDGETRFQAAIKAGRLSRDRMFKAS